MPALSLMSEIMLFLLGYRYVYFTGECAVGESPVQLGDEADCIQLSIENPSTNEDNTENAVEILYGDATRQRRRLKPGYNTEWIPASEARQLYVRTATGSGETCTITYSGTRLEKR